MNANVETKEFRFDLFKWVLIIALVVGGVWANSFYENDIGLLYRVLGICGLMIVALFIAVNTATGDKFWELLKASQVELRKVVWPSRQEVNQTTLLVLAVVLIAALLLWGLDALIGLGVSQIIA